MAGPLLKLRCWPSHFRRSGSRLRRAPYHGQQRRRQPPISFGDSTPTRNSTGSIKLSKLSDKYQESFHPACDRRAGAAYGHRKSGIEHVHRFTRAVSVGNPREFLQAEKQEQEIAKACKRLIKNCIICWNYLYLSISPQNCWTKQAPISGPAESPKVLQK